MHRNGGSLFRGGKNMSELRELEDKSIFTIREAVARLKNLAALWSTGKDSTVLVALARKAFLGRVPFPLIHIDNGIDFPETYAFRERLSKEWG
jgi:sulfate adenylyltransferase subunit 2